MDLHPDDYPRALTDPAVRERRRAMLSLPHVAPLAAYAARLRETGLGKVQDFDPLDGGVAARILFLLEKPGPMTDPARPGRSGSGFTSRNNDDQTAVATWHFMRAASLPREATLIWNAVPWWNGTVKLTAAERAQGRAALPGLLALLPRVHTAVLVGRTAGAARPVLGGLRVLESAHPSPQVRAGNRALWDAIPEVWRAAGSCYIPQDE